MKLKELEELVESLKQKTDMINWNRLLCLTSKIYFESAIPDKILLNVCTNIEFTYEANTIVSWKTLPFAVCQPCLVPIVHVRSVKCEEVWDMHQACAHCVSNWGESEPID